MPLPVRKLQRADLRVHDGDPHLNEEWLVTNGLGGYASGTVAGALTRRYHGLLIAALPNPLGRTMTLNALSERIRLPNRDVYFTGPNELIGVDPPGTIAPREFRLEGGLPVWRYELAATSGEAPLHGLPAEYGSRHVSSALRPRAGSPRPSPRHSFPLTRRSCEYSAGKEVHDDGDGRRL